MWKQQARSALHRPGLRGCSNYWLFLVSGTAFLVGFCLGLLCFFFSFLCLSSRFLFCLLVGLGRVHRYRFFSILCCCFIGFLLFLGFFSGFLVFSGCLFLGFAWL